MSPQAWRNGEFYSAEFIGDNSWNGYEHDVLLRNDGDGKRFTDIAHVTGIDLDTDARGVAYLDYDQDGALDVMVVNHRQPAVLLHNNVGSKNHWLAVELQGTKSNRQGVGARITYTANGVKRIREVRAGGGFLSSSSVPPLLGLGKAAQVDELTIRWPGGVVQRLTGIAADRKIRVMEPK